MSEQHISQTRNKMSGIVLLVRLACHPFSFPQDMKSTKHALTDLRM